MTGKKIGRSEAIVETTTTTTTEAQRSISPIQPNFTTPKLKNPTLQQTIIQSTVKPSVAQKYSQMDYPTFRPVTKPSYKQQTSHRNNFAKHNYNYANGPKTTKSSKTNTQNSIKFQSADEEYYNQNHQRFYSSQRPRSYSIDQPHIFKSYTRNEQVRQSRNKPTSYNNKFQHQNPINTQSYQPTQMHNEIPLLYYLQQHEIRKSQLTIFCQMPHAAESLQMTMNPYLMGGLSISSNKPLMVFTGTDPEYSVEDYLNAVTSNLILNIGPEPINTPLHQNWIHRRTALIQATLDCAAQKWFSVLPIEIKSDWKRFTQEFSKLFDSERNKQHQRVLCKEFRRLHNEKI